MSFEQGKSQLHNIEVAVQSYHVYGKDAPEYLRLAQEIKNILRELILTDDRQRIAHRAHITGDIDQIFDEQRERLKLMLVRAISQTKVLEDVVMVRFGSQEVKNPVVDQFNHGEPPSEAEIEAANSKPNSRAQAKVGTGKIQSSAIEIFTSASMISATLANLISGNISVEAVLAQQNQEQIPDLISEEPFYATGHTISRTNFRSSPSTANSSNILTTLDQGTEVYIRSRVVGDKNGLYYRVTVIIDDVPTEGFIATSQLLDRVLILSEVPTGPATPAAAAAPAAPDMPATENGQAGSKEAGIGVNEIATAIAEGRLVATPDNAGFVMAGNGDPRNEYYQRYYARVLEAFSSRQELLLPTIKPGEMSDFVSGGEAVPFGLFRKTQLTGPETFEGVTKTVYEYLVIAKFRGSVEIVAPNGVQAVLLVFEVKTENGKSFNIITYASTDFKLGEVMNKDLESLSVPFDQTTQKILNAFQAQSIGKSVIIQFINNKNPSSYGAEAIKEENVLFAALEQTLEGGYPYPQINLPNISILALSH